MTKKEMCRKITDLGKYGKRTLVYSITSEEAVDGSVQAEFGIAVMVIESGEESEVRRITPDEEKAQKLLDVLATNFVTPVSLKYVVEDWLIK